MGQGFIAFAVVALMAIVAAFGSQDANAQPVTSDLVVQQDGSIPN